MQLKVLILCFLSIGLNSGAFAQQEPLLEILENEMGRVFAELKQKEYPPYYMEYRVDESHLMEIGATMGSLSESATYSNRSLATTIRIGDYSQDNSHMEESGNSQATVHGIIPIENVPEAIKQYMWLMTDAAYKQSLEGYLEVLSNSKDSTQSNLFDFSIESPNVCVEGSMPDLQEEIDRAYWQKLLKKITSLFSRTDSILGGNARLQVRYLRKYLVSTEGSRLAQNSRLIQLSVQAAMVAPDGNLVDLSNVYYYTAPTSFPQEDHLIQQTSGLIDQLKKLSKAPKAEPFAGPAILSNEVSGVFFHEIFGHRIEGHRLRSDHDGQTFKNKIGEKVLPKFMDVVFDPTIEQSDTFRLIGSYRYDDQGMKSERVRVIEKGVLKKFLMSRRPMASQIQSNGHGRSAAGFNPVARQSNMLVTTDKPMSDKALRKKLLKECKNQKVAYGYYIKKVEGGFTATDRYQPNSFNIKPTEVYRIYVDGRPDELVRGVDLIGTPLTMFSEIEGTGSQLGLFNGFCGAESGYVPVSAVAPALFIRKIETQKQPENNHEMPILSNPVIHGNKDRSDEDY